MPDFQNFKITRANNRNLNVPTWNIEGQITNSRTGAIIQDFMGAQAIQFPQILGQLTTQQQNEFIEEVIQLLIQRRFNL